MSMKNHYHGHFGNKPAGNGYKDGAMSENTLLSSRDSFAASNGWVQALFITLLVLIYPVTGHSQGSTFLTGLAGKCLDMAGVNPSDGTPTILRPCRKDAPNQEWSFATNGTIRSVGGKCLDVAGGRPNNGTPVILWSCHGGPNQQWHLAEDQTIRGLAGKCLSVTGGNSNEGTPIILWPCHGGPDQQWKKSPFFDLPLPHAPQSRQ